jgi:glycosyltransferase involved in cell wall biosynthesis
MRVLHVNHKAGFQGGVERIVYDTAQSLADLGWPQALLYESKDADSTYCKLFAESGEDVGLIERFAPDVILIHKCESIERISHLALSARTLRMVHDHDIFCMRRHKYFPLNSRVCNLPAGLACYRNLCFLQKAPPGSVFPITLGSLSRQREIISINQQLDGFIVGSPWMRDEMLMNGFAAERVHIIPPVPASLSEVSYSPVTESREILFVGQVIRGKGVDLLLKAVAGLQGDWHLTVAGEGNHLHECKKLASRLGIAEKVNFAGWVNHEQLDDYYSRALFLVVPSRWPEPFGMVGIEAMARGRGVVGFATGGIPYWLTDRQTGLLADEADINGLTECMQQLLDNPAMAAAMGKAALEQVGQRFTHENYLNQMRQLLENSA